MLLQKLPDDIDSFEKWLKYKEEQEQRITHGAEHIEIDDALYDVVMAINRVCFDHNAAMICIPLYYIPAEMAAERDYPAAMYGYGRIMIDEHYYKAGGVNEDIINTLFHEMVHMWCDIHDIQDTDGEAHTEKFADAVEAHGGRCEWENSRYGYTITELTVNSMKKVKRELKKMTDTKGKVTTWDS